MGDAVGLTIGGPCFLLAFCGYLGTMQRGDFYRGSIDLQYSDHPVTWLRVRLLAERTRAVGFGDLAHDMEGEWDLVARTMGVVEDYHGFYDPAFRTALSRTIDDMLVETQPRQCSGPEASGEGWGEQPGLLLSLFNQAWKVYTENPSTYADWEGEALRRLLG